MYCRIHKDTDLIAGFTLKCVEIITFIVLIMFALNDVKIAYLNS